MILSDRDIRNALDLHTIEITPRPFDDCFQPCTVDLHLGDAFTFDPGGPCEHSVQGLSVFWLRPGDFILASLQESITLPSNIRGQIKGKSSLGRRGLMVSGDVGYVDPGWSGVLTIELFNQSSHDIRLTPGMKICQIEFAYLTTAARRPYGHSELKSHYQGSTTVRAGVTE